MSKDIDSMKNRRKALGTRIARIDKEIDRLGDKIFWLRVSLRTESLLNQGSLTAYNDLDKVEARQQ